MKAKEKEIVQLSDAELEELECRFAVEAAKYGEASDLAGFIEDGGELCEEAREFLAASLRRQTKPGSGRRRTWRQKMHEKHVVGAVWWLQDAYGVSQEKAFEMCCGIDPESLLTGQSEEPSEDRRVMDYETFRTYVRNVKKDR